MAKSIKNKQYNEFWEDKDLLINKSNKDSDDNLPLDEIKKIEKKITKKVSVLEKEIKEEHKEVKPVNKPKGWHAKVEFIDDDGNKFSKGKFVGKVDETKVESIDVVDLLVDTLNQELKKSINDGLEKTETPKEPVIDVVDLSPPVHKVLTNKEIHQQYIDDGVPFKMYFRGNIIFNSEIQPIKNYPIFNDDGFILFGKNYIYRGIRVEKY